MKTAEGPQLEMRSGEIPGHGGACAAAHRGRLAAKRAAKEQQPEAAEGLQRAEVARAPPSRRGAMDPLEFDPSWLGVDSLKREEKMPMKPSKKYVGVEIQSLCWP
jgi:hypothetical protein